MPSALEVEVDRNFDAFMVQLARFLPAHRGSWALMRDTAVCDFFPDEGQALQAGRDKFSDGLYSIQEVTDRPVDLGFFSHAVDTRLA